MRAFISSPSDLVAHRRAAIDGCLEVGVVPIAQEVFPASSSTPLDTVANVIREADVFLIIVGFRYSEYVEIEYDLAAQLGKPMLFFTVADTHPVLPRDIDTGEAAIRIDEFRKRLLQNRLAFLFSSPDQLRRSIVFSLGRMVTARAVPPSRPGVEAVGVDVGTPTVRGYEPLRARIPRAPSRPHPRVFVGRDREFNFLETWCSAAGEVDARVVLIVGLGGIGKTTLAQRIFDGSAARRFDFLDGRFWWDFYDEPSIDRFGEALLDYLLGPSRAAGESQSGVSYLLEVLQDREILLVLDGFEQLLMESSASVGEPTLRASRSWDAKDEIAPRVFIGRGYSRPSIVPTSDLPRRIRSGSTRALLLGLAGLRRVRTIVTSRLIPADIEVLEGVPLVGFRILPLAGLTTEATVSLLRRFGVNGPQAVLSELATQTAGVPLVARLVASQVAHTGRLTREFDELTANSSTRSVIGGALDRLTRPQQDLLKLLAKPEEAVHQTQLATEAAALGFGAVELDAALALLENVSLMTWNRDANTYSVHPLVRAAVLKTSS